MNVTRGIPIDHITIEGIATSAHQAKCSFEYHFIFRSILTFESPLSISTHWNTIRKVRVIVGRNMNNMTILVTTMFRIRSLISLFKSYIHKDPCTGCKQQQ